jgi:hypothetical protein
MVQMPTFAEFRARLAAEFQCSWEAAPSELSVDDEPPQTVNYFKRVVNGVTLTYSIFIGDTDRMTPTVLRSACSQLQIDPARFGLTLG